MTTPTTFKAVLTSFNSNDTETDTYSSSRDSHKRKRITDAEAALECVKEDVVDVHQDLFSCSRLKGDAIRSPPALVISTVMLVLL
jgi:hypothetical protein